MASVIPIEGCANCAPLVAELRAHSAALRAENAELRARDAEKQAQIEALTQRVTALEEIVRANSTNSSKPPSSDGPAVQRPKKEKSGRKRGAQPGHEGKARESVPPERVDRVVEVRPERCEHCQAPLSAEPESYRPHQVIHLPRVRAEVVEWRLGIVRCPECQHKTEAPLPPEVPRGSFSPGTQAIVAWASAWLRLSKRKIAEALGDLYNVPISIGSVVALERLASGAVAEPVEEACRHVQDAPGAKHLDETSWKEGQKKAWLWVAVSGLVAVFLVRFSRGRKVAKELLGPFVRGIIVSDRYSAYNWLGVYLRQLCWAHLLRDFKAAAERDGPGKRIAEALVRATKAMFHHWKRVRKGQITHSTFRTRYAPRARATIHALLVQGQVCPDKKLAALSRWLLKRESAMWTFARVEGVEPTNNAAERALRHAVLWRRSSHGTQSREGSLFVQRMLTVITTLRLQKRDVLDYLTAACHAAQLGLPAPSLLPASQHSTRAQPLQATG